MELSLLSYNFYKDSDIYFGFDSQISDSEQRKYFLLNSSSLLSEENLEIIEKKSISLNSILVKKYLIQNNEDSNKFKYYQFYFNPLLIYITQLYLFRLKLLENVFSEFLIESVVVTSIEPYFERPKDTNESLQYLLSENVNTWLNSFIFQKRRHSLVLFNRCLINFYFF